MAVCAEMFWAEYGVVEVWMVLTDPAHDISKEFCEKDGESAEAHLDLLIANAYEEATGGRAGNE